jgi:peptidyl-tRNA hydrolase, PTH2 family
MSPGKAASQAGHAFLDTFHKCREDDPLRALEYQGDSHGTKVVLVARTLEQMMKAKHLAEHNGIPCALITDSGHVMPPHFDGTPVVTALGIGPCRREEIHAITKRFQLYR